MVRATSPDPMISTLSRPMPASRRRIVVKRSNMRPTTTSTMLSSQA